MLAAAVLAAVFTFDSWQRPLEHFLWPPKVGEHGELAYELVSETPVRPYPDAVSARLFVENDGPEGSPEVGVMIEPQGRLLTAAQRREFEDSLSKVSSRGGSAAACFIPHHFLRYYDAAGQKVGEIAVCFCCSGAVSTPALFPYQGGGPLHPYWNELAYDRERLKSLIESLGLPADVWCRERDEPR
ncbi:hypothetical protein [Brevundimonas lenta]|uniref:Uncharacterized protein n=1 Tax=Brevundimonas lenta TaxID=424796 RepID=A0A7W6JCX4_9CAUL|nr:hypothetical protein [Brevundimonas lenta]MBB4081841.1 hypothetical protein [Brevundimonas lenta]